MDTNTSHSSEIFYYSESTYIKSIFNSVRVTRWCDTYIILYWGYKLTFFTCLELFCEIST